MSRLFVSFLNTLNDDLGEELPAAKGDVAAAVDVVAAEWDMKLIAVSHHPITGEEDGNCRIYWSREFRRYVNCWLEAPSDKVRARAASGSMTRSIGGRTKKREWRIRNEVPMVFTEVRHVFRPPLQRSGDSAAGRERCLLGGRSVAGWP